MPALGKETEHQLTPDEIASREIEGYLDKVEHQAETQLPQTAKVTLAPTPPASGQVSSTTTDFSQAPGLGATKIVLPLDQAEVEGGLSRGILEGFRWLAEWCVMMIKKYPGRVFYLPPQANK